MTPITPNEVNAMSMFDIIVYLHSIHKKSHDKEYTCNDKPYPKSMHGELIRYKVTNDHYFHNELAYIIAIVGEVVYDKLYVVS